MKISFSLFLAWLIWAVPAAKAQLTWITNSDNSLTITGFNNTAPYPVPLTIPSAINGLPVTSIAGFAFYDNLNLTSVTIPNSVTSIGKLAFEYCSLGSVTIGTGLTSIGDEVFCACPNLTNVVLGTNIAVIGAAAFLECGRLANVTMGNNVTDIEENAFAECPLTSVTIPASVTSIGPTAFQYCTSLSNVSIPSSATNIGTNAFLGCFRLVAISVATNNPAYSSLGGVLFNKSQTTLIDYPSGNGASSFTVPDSVTNIEVNAFNSSYNLTNVTFGTSVTSIGSNAFANCSALTSLTLGTNVSCIGAYAFQDCSSLTNITFPLGLTRIGDGAFSGCVDLFSVTLPGSLTNFGDGAFEGCTGLTAITANPTNSFFSSVNGVLFNKSENVLLEFPDGLVGNYNIPTGVTSIGDAFEGCSLTSVSIPTGVTSIGSNAFEGCARLTSVTVGSAVTNILDGAFVQCSSLTGIYFLGSPPPGADSALFANDINAIVYYVPGTNGWGPSFGGAPTGLWDPQFQCAYAITNGMIAITGYNGPGGTVAIPLTINGIPVTSIVSNAFSSFTTLTNVTIPNSVSTIGSGAFSGCINLVSVAIPSSVTSLGNGVFEGCASLASVTVPNSLNQIPEYTFEFCTGLTNITIPNTIVFIAANAFSGTSLTSVTIPSSVSIIRDEAFSQCYDLRAIYFEGTPPSADSSVFAFDSATAYYLPGMAGWGTTFGGIPTKKLSTLEVAFGSLPSGTNGVAYSQQLNASGGNAPYAWTLTAGGLPNGLSLATGGLISGTPTTNGTFNFTVKVTDTTNSTTTQALTLTINSGTLQVATTWLLGGTTTVPYTQSLVASGGTPPYAWTSLLGALPPGLSLANNGSISGTPTFAGNDTFTVSVIDASNSVATQTLSLAVSVFSRLQITTVSLPNGTNGVAYNQQLAAAYGQPPYTWSFLSNSSLPGLTLAANGTISGVPIFGGTASFMVQVTDALSTTQTETLTLTMTAKVLHTFGGYSGDGGNPSAGLILSGRTLYGEASQGGTDGNGTIFAVNTDGTGFTNLYNFSTLTYVSVFPGPGYYLTNSDGANPQGGLLLSGNTLYGTANSGGNPGYGTVYRVNTDGTGFTNLHSFDFYDGFSPDGGLVLSGNTLYGTTVGGGTSLVGTVFSINTDGTGFMTLHSFTATTGTGGIDATGTNTDGEWPRAALLLSGNTLYGTASYGGSWGDGAVFSVNTNGTGFTTLHSFGNANDGYHPWTALVLSGDILYATTEGGTVFAVNTDGTDFRILCIVGAYPYAGLILSGSTLYGTTTQSGIFGNGTVFAVNTDGTGFTNIYEFTPNSYDGNIGKTTNSDGLYPYCNLIVTNNTLYGTTEYGGISGDGTAFSLSLEPYLQYTSAPTNGGVPLSVQFTSMAVDSLGNAITSWNWTFGDGTVSTIQSPVHVYTNDGTFLPSLIATNNLGVAVSGSGPSITAELSSGNPQPSSGLVFNGGFETGDFTGWTLTGNSWSFVDDGSQSGIAPYSGNYEAELGTLSSLGYLSQTLSTTAGASYLLSLWLDSPDGQTPNEFLVSWNGNILFDEKNIPAIGWTNLQFLVSATGMSTVLEFGFRDDPSYLLVDDISVVSVPTVAFTANPTNGLVPLVVSFTSADVDSSGNTISHWDWAFGDGATTNTQNPSHTYTTAGTFVPTLIATNNLGVAVFGYGSSITVSPDTVVFEANPTNGLAPLTVSFTCPSIDSGGNAISRWNWAFGDGATTNTQNPSHTYTTAGTFVPTLIATNNLGVAVFGYGPAAITATNAPLQSGLVVNGGFETGDFTSWTLSGLDTTDIIVDDGSVTGITPHSGNYLAGLGPVGSVSYLSQALATTPGSAYSISLWLNNPNGSPPNEFLVSWNGQILFDRLDLPMTAGWTNLQFAVLATGNNTVLQFGARDDASWLGLDDVSVLPVVTPPLGNIAISLSGTSLVFRGTNGRSGGTYYVLSSTNIALPLSSWTPVATNISSANGNFTVTVTNTVTPTVRQRFYILQTQ